jgi:hypothetical protein
LVEAIQDSEPGVKPAAGAGGLTEADNDASTPAAATAAAGKMRALRPEAGLVLAERGCKLLLITAPKRTALALELIQLAGALEVKLAFFHDRAHAVINQTLLHLDQQYQDIGFGSWMPFRFPDQWLSFCGIMTRVLAANGLMHAKHADTYRKLLDETPPVEVEGTVQDRIKKARTPINIAKCHSNRGARTMEDLKQRLRIEVWDRQDAEAARPYEYTPEPPP